MAPANPLRSDPPPAAPPAADLLTLDRGNTTLDGMWHGDPAERLRVDPDDADAVRGLLQRRSTGRVAALTVVPAGLATVEARLQEQNRELWLAGRELPCPLELAYSEAAGLGVDRWVAAVAAHDAYGAAVVVDCGTAVTVDVVDAGGVFRGGAIAPGVWTMARALAVAAPALPGADLEAVCAVPASSSQAAVDAGVQIGFAGLVDRLIEEARRGAAVPDAQVVLTGGLAGVYARHGRSAFRLHEDLVHQGLRWLAERRVSSS